MKYSTILILALCMSVVIGCEGSSSGDKSSSEPVNVAGKWNFYDHSVSDIIVAGTLSLSQSGPSVQGSYSAVDGFTGKIAGGVDGSQFDALIIFDRIPVSTTLKGKVDGDTMRGSWSSTSGASGRFHAVRL